MVKLVAGASGEKHLIIIVVVACADGYGLVWCGVDDGIIIELLKGGCDAVRRWFARLVFVRCLVLNRNAYLFESSCKYAESGVSCFVTTRRVEEMDGKVRKCVK